MNFSSEWDVFLLMQNVLVAKHLTDIGISVYLNWAVKRRDEFVEFVVFYLKLPNSDKQNTYCLLKCITLTIGNWRMDKEKTERCWAKFRGKQKKNRLDDCN